MLIALFIAPVFVTCCIYVSVISVVDFLIYRESYCEDSTLSVLSELQNSIPTMCLIVFIRPRNRSAEQTRAREIRAWLRMYLGIDNYDYGDDQSPHLPPYGKGDERIEQLVASLNTRGTGSAGQDIESRLVQ